MTRYFHSKRFISPQQKCFSRSLLIEPNSLEQASAPECRVWMCEFGPTLWSAEHKCVTQSVSACEWKGRENACVSSARPCVHVYTVLLCIQHCVWVCVCVGLLYTALGAKTLEIALIWILFVSSNHNHVTNSPRQKRLIHGAERRPSCMLLLYIHFILQELCPQNGFIHLQEPHNGEGQKNFTVNVKAVTPRYIYLAESTLLWSALFRKRLRNTDSDGRKFQKSI